MACSSAAGQMPNTSTVALTHRRSLPGRFYLFVVELVMGLSFCETVSVCVSPCHRQKGFCLPLQWELIL